MKKKRFSVQPMKKKKTTKKMIFNQKNNKVLKNQIQIKMRALLIRQKIS